jgi:hypothetical protein
MRKTKNVIETTIVISIVAIVAFMIIFPKHWIEATIISPIPPIP